MSGHISDLDDVLSSISTATHYDALWERLVAVLTRNGVDIVSYHHFTPSYALDKSRVDIISYGFPRAWDAHYAKAKLFRDDPFIAQARNSATPFRLRGLIESRKFNKAQTRYIAELTEWMKGDAYFIPAFGLSGRNAYFCIANSASIEDWSAQSLQMKQLICQCFHIRYCSLRLEELPVNFSLTDEEYEIIKALGDARTLAVIAEDRGLNLSYIESLIETVMTKMHVTDYPSLMIRAVKLGIVKPLQ